MSRRTLTLKLRTREYRVSVDDLVHRDGSVSRLVFCDGRPVGAPFFPERRLPKAVQNIIAELGKQEEDAMTNCRL